MSMEDFVLQTQILAQFELEEPKDFVVKAIILLPKNIRLNNGYNEILLGRTMKCWVTKALDNFQIKYAELSEKDNALELVKDLIEDEDFTVVLYADTPLIKNTTIYDVVEYAQTKMLDFCKLPRGFVVASQNYKKGIVNLSAEPTFIEKEDFYTIFDNKTLCKAKEVLKARILDKHLKNKVVIEDVSTIFIDADVQISNNVVIKPFNVLQGNTIIEEGVVLQEYNKIEDSVIGANSEVGFSVIKNAAIKKGSMIGPFENINNLKEGDKK